MKEATAQSFSWLMYVKIFLFVVFLVFLIAVVIRTVFAIQKASFTQNSFNVLITCTNSYLVGIDRKAKRLSIADFGNIREQLVGKSKFQIGVLLHIPVNAQLVYKKGSTCPNADKDYLTFDNTYKLLTNSAITYKKINRFDLFKLYFIARGFPEDSKKFKSIDLNLADLDIQLTDMFQDKRAREKALTIEIVNATSINGLGSKVSQMLQNGGYNVIGIRSESGSGANSSIAIGTNVNKKDASPLVAALDLPVVYNDSLTVSDMRIYLEPDLEAGFSD